LDVKRLAIAAALSVPSCGNQYSDINYAELITECNRIIESKQRTVNVVDFDEIKRLSPSELEVHENIVIIKLRRKVGIVKTAGDCPTIELARIAIK
jgi:hypothetical protein